MNILIRSWGLQTIMFAMSIRSNRIGKPIDGIGRVGAASKEANATAKELWESSLEECSKPVKAPEMIMKFTSRVFEWSIDHLTG